MRLHIHHTTSYRYATAGAHCTQYLRLTPPDSPRQKILSWQLRLPADAARTLDAYGNVMHVVTVDAPHQDVLIEAEGIVEVEDCATEQADGLSPLLFLRATPLTTADSTMVAFALPLASTMHGSPQDTALKLMQKLRKRITLATTSATDTTAADAFAAGCGTAIDLTHVFLACAHAIGLPARFVSGYLYSNGGGDVSDHAWAEVWLGDSWWGLDIARGCETSHQHLKLAVGMDWLEACPVRDMPASRDGRQIEARAQVRMLDH